MDIFIICSALFLGCVAVVAFIFYRSDKRPSGFTARSHLDYCKPVIGDELHPSQRIPQPAAPVASATPRRTFFLQVHGITFRQDAVKRCKLRERLLLIPEPDNPVSTTAIKVCRENGECIGYVPSPNSAHMISDMSIGWTYAASVGELWHEGNTTGCLMRIDVLTMSYRTEARLAKKQAST